MNRTRLTLFVGASLAAATSSQAHAQNWTERWLTVNCHTWIPHWQGCSTGAVDGMFTDANSRVWNDSDGPGQDYNCPHFMFRNGAIGTFGNAGGYWEGDLFDIDNGAELGAVLDSAAGYVKIVNEINFCEDRVATFAGCANWNSMVLSEPFVAGWMTAVSPGALLAHEFGHTVGLNHDLSSSAMIMHPDVGWNAEVLTQSECVSFTMPNLSSNGGPGGAEFKPKRIDDGTDLSGIPIEELATSGFVDTVPAEVEDFYDEEDVATLRRMLQDPEYASNRRTIASLIGLISDGADEDVDALNALLSSPTVSSGDKIGAGIGLGYISNRTHHRAALKRLAEASRSGEAAVVKAAVFGLWLSGRPEALGELRRVKARLAQHRPRARSSDMVSEATVDQAIADQPKLSRGGLRAYYRRR